MKYKLKDAIYGLAIGDAMGLPVQFKERNTYKKVTDMTKDSYINLPKGTFSDDTSMTLATCDSIKKNGKINSKDIRNCFENWYYRGSYTTTGYAIDIGETCGDAIELGIGINKERANGNGSLMRILPLAFIDNITDEEIAAVSSITHAHERSIEGCIIYVRIAIGLLNGQTLKDLILKYVDKDSMYSDLRYIEEFTEEEISSSGYIVDTLEATLWCLLTTANYEDCIIKAVNLGGDTDTIAAVAGGLAGIIYGYENIPKRWIVDLKGKDIIDSVLF
jgi:ADP-ribosylglycohydrolase